MFPCHLPTTARTPPPPHTLLSMVMSCRLHRGKMFLFSSFFFWSCASVILHYWSYLVSSGELPAPNWSPPFISSLVRSSFLFFFFNSPPLIDESPLWPRSRRKPRSNKQYGYKLLLKTNNLNYGSLNTFEQSCNKQSTAATRVSPRCVNCRDYLVSFKHSLMNTRSGALFGVGSTCFSALN